LRITQEIRRACHEQGIRTNYLKLLSRFPEKFLEYLSRPTPRDSQLPGGLD